MQMACVDFSSCFFCGFSGCSFVNDTAPMHTAWLTFRAMRPRPLPHHRLLVSSNTDFPADLWTKSTKTTRHLNNTTTTEHHRLRLKNTKPQKHQRIQKTRERDNNGAPKPAAENYKDEHRQNNPQIEKHGNNGAPAKLGRAV